MKGKAQLFGPEHPVCTDTVEIPTVRRSPRDNTFCVQWRGQAQSELPDDVVIPPDAQFLFPIPAAGTDSPRFALGTSSFAVPFLAPAKEWPTDTTRQQVINGPGEGNPNTCLLWALNPSVLLEGDQIAQVLVAVALLGDPNCGVLEPEPFVDLSVRENALRLFYSGFDLDPPDEFV